MKIKMIALISILLLIAVLVGVYYIGKEQDNRSRAAPATSLSFSPSSVSKKLGDTFSLDVVVNTGTNTISAADLVINTESTKLKITGLTVGSYLTTTLLTPSYTDSRATVTLGSSPTSPKKGTGILATVTFQVVGAGGSTQISFTGSQVAGIGEQGNVLSSSTPATITLTSSSGGTSPSLTPTRMPTALPTQAASSPSTTPTRTPTPTTQTGSPQITATPSPSPSPTPTSSSSSLSITNPSEDETFNSSMVTFTGTAPVGSSVTITILGDSNTPVITADNNGQWSYTPSTPLSDGQHQVTVVSVALGGATSTLSKTFFVTTSAPPVSGVMDYLFLPLGVGSLLVLLGLLL